MKKQKILTASLIIITTFLTSSFLISNDSYAEHTLTLSTSSIQEIEVSASGSGTTISEAEINVATTCHAGYNLTLSTTVQDNNLYLDGDPDNNSTGTYFAPSDGVTSLISANNTWGFYLPSSNNETPTTNSVFNAVPTLGSSIAIRTPLETARDSAIDDTFSIYYGVKVASSTLAGQYKMIEDEDHNSGTIVYYATLPEDCFRYTVEYSPTGTNTGVSVTGTGNVTNQTMLEGVTSNLTTEVFGNPTIDGTTYYFIGWNTEQDGTGTQYSSGQSVTNLTTAENTIILYAQWTDCPAEHICYYKNNQNADGSMGHQAASSNSSATLLAPNYSLANNGFAGWSEDKNAATKLANHETVTIYGPNETITTGDLSIYGLHLYAIWLEAEETLQEWDSCDELEIGEVIALQDARDDNAYTVAKLADGKCWMTENLRLDSENSVGAKASLAQGYNSSFTGLADPETENFADSSVANSLYSTNGTTENIITGDLHSSRFPRYNNSNTLSSANKPTDGNANIYGYGNYYTWSAAIADTSLYSSSNTSINVTSICPDGWRVPRGGDKSIESSNDFWRLIVDGIEEGVQPTNYSSSTRPYYSGSVEATPVSEALRRFPNNLLQSGYYYNTSALNRDTMGNYWTTTTSVSNGAYLLNIESTRVDPGTTYSNRYRGYSIRCLQIEK